MKHHTDLTQERWNKFSLFMQLANVGCDVSRAIRHRKNGRSVDSSYAFERALELWHLTVADPKNKGRLRELTKAREAFIDFFMYDNEYNTTEEQWENYFYDFNYAAAIERGL